MMVPAEEMKNYIGEEVGVSDWLEITQDRINQFAEGTNDHQFIHVDPEMAKSTPWGSTIAHGFLTLSLLSYLNYILIFFRICASSSSICSRGLNSTSSESS